MQGHGISVTVYSPHRFKTVTISKVTYVFRNHTCRVPLGVAQYLERQVNVPGLPPEEQMYRIMESGYSMYGKIEPKTPKIRFEPDRVRSVVTDGRNSFRDTVIFFTANTGAYSGGRYYNYMFIVALAKAGYNVVVVTNRRPVFTTDFPGYRNISWCTSNIRKYLGRLPELRVAFTVGSQHEHIGMANTCAVNNNVNSYGIVYETPNWLKEMNVNEPEARDDSTRVKAWKSMCLSSTFLVLLCGTGKRYMYDWLLDYPKERIICIEPGVNDDAVPDVLPGKKEDRIVFCSRLVDRKKWVQMMSALVGIRRRFDIHLVASNATNVHREFKNNDWHKIVSHQSVSDVKKMKIIAGSRLMVNGSMFEGFGITPAEAMLTKVPVVAYGLPVYKENYKSNILYAKMGNLKDLEAKVLWAWDHLAAVSRLADKAYTFASERYRFEHFCNRVYSRLPDISGEVVEAKSGVR